MNSTESPRVRRDRVRRDRVRWSRVSSWWVAVSCLALASCGSSAPEPTVPEAPEVIPTDSAPEVDPTPEAPVVDPAAVDLAARAELPAAAESDEAPALPAEPSAATPPAADAPAADAPAPKKPAPKKPAPKKPAPKKPATPAKPSTSKPSTSKPSEAPAAGYTGDQPCKATSFKVKAVEKACHEGGRSAAKDLMKKAVEKAKAGGVSLKCTSCHVDQKAYAIQPNAIADLQRWL